MKTTKKLKNFGLSLLVVSNFACSAKVETPQSVPNDNTPQGDPQGPFDIKFDSNNSFEHSLKINIQQDEGIIEYKFNPGTRVDLILEESNSAVTGCDAQTVKHDIYWFSDENNKVYYQILKPNSKFYTGRKTTGVILHSFKNLQNCEFIEMKTRVKKETKTTKLGQVCEGFASADQCKLHSYCKEQIVATPFYEVEVWNQQGVLTAKKFIVRTDGTRGLMSSYSVSLTDSVPTALFSSTSNNSFTLLISNTTYDGTATERIAGNTYYLNLACEL